MLKDSLWMSATNALRKAWGRDQDVHLRILTWNVADFDPASLISKTAPSSWSVERNRGALLAAIKSTGADVALLQECPSSNFELDPLEYDRTSTCASHCGYVHAFARRDEDSWHVESSRALTSCPAVLVTLAKKGKRVNVCTMHLHPGKEGAEKRKRQLSFISSSLSPSARKGVPFIVAGDANMRNAEMKGIPSDLHAIPTAPTWDSRKNKYHGENAFAFKCTFDRAFVSSQVRVLGATLMGDRPVTIQNTHAWYLSDHFGICIDVAIPPFLSSCDEK